MNTGIDKQLAGYFQTNKILISFLSSIKMQKFCKVSRENFMEKAHTHDMLNFWLVLETYDKIYPFKIIKYEQGILCLSRTLGMSGIGI